MGASSGFETSLNALLYRGIQDRLLPEMHNLRQLYPTVTYLRVYFPSSKHRASIAQSVRRYSDFGEEKESGIQKPSSSDSAEGEKGGRKGQASKG